MDKHALVTMSNNSREAKKFFGWLRSNVDSFKVLGVNSAEDETGIDYYELVSIFRDLAELGAGNFIVGRKGHDSRIVWHFNTKHIGKAAYEELSIFSDIGAVPDDAVTLSDPAKLNKTENSIKHSFNLRKDFEVELILPEDLSENDISRLKSWLDLLVY